MSGQNLLDAIENEAIKGEIPEFRSGDTVRVHTKVKEGNRERIQIFEGMVIQRKNSSARATFTVRKVSFGVGVEKVFPLHSPQIERVEVVKTGKVRQSRIYYMRGRTHKQSRLRERDLPGQKTGSTTATAAKSVASPAPAAVESSPAVSAE